MLSKHISLVIVGIAISLIAVGVISYTNTSDAADTYTDGNWTFTVDGTNATIISNTETGVANLNIPSTVTADGNTYTVTGIGDGTSSIVNNENLTANCVVVIPNTVTIINGYAFRYCTKISDITLPTSLTIIGNRAFQGCTNLALTSLPDGVTSIGSRAFMDCTNLVLTSLPDSVTSISSYAFHNCTSLALVSLPSGLTSIGDSTFQNCTNLALTSLPSGVATISSSAFAGCTNLALTSLPSGLTSIGNSAFMQCTNLALTSLPDSITSIGGSTFSGCTSLALTSLPSGVTSIYMSAFAGCTNLALTSLPNELTSIGNGAFEGCTSLALTSLPNGITSIGGSTFSGCTNLALTSLPDGVTTIGGNAFNSCTSLALTSLPDGLTSIGTYAFENCTGIESLILTPNLETIGDNAFQNCTNLKTIYNASDLTLTIGGTDNGRVAQYAENIYDDLHILTILSNNTSYGTVSQSTAYAVDGGTISVSGDTITISEPAQTIKAIPTSPMYKVTRWANTTGEITANRPIVAVFESNEMTVSVSPGILYLVTGGPIPNTSSETVSLSYTGFGDGTYTWSIVNDGGTGVNVTADGRIYGTAGDVTVSPVTVTIRLTGTVDGVTQTKDVTFDVMIVAKLIFTTNPIDNGVIA